MKNQRDISRPPRSPPYPSIHILETILFEILFRTDVCKEKKRGCTERRTKRENENKKYPIIKSPGVVGGGWGDGGCPALSARPDTFLPRLLTAYLINPEQKITAG